MILKAFFHLGNCIKLKLHLSNPLYFLLNEKVKMNYGIRQNMQNYEIWEVESVIFIISYLRIVFIINLWDWVGMLEFINTVN